MEYYVLRNNLKTGPYSFEDLKTQNLDANTMIWRIGYQQWMPAQQVEELKPLLAASPPPPPSTNQTTAPKTWLLESILVTCFCCLPLGIIGIIYATKVESNFLGGQYELSNYYSNVAKKWTTWGFFIGLIVFLLYASTFALIPFFGLMKRVLFLPYF